MSFATWFSFFIAACLIAISPGSGAVLSMSHGLSYGLRKASGTILGLQLGLLMVMVIAGAGVGSLLVASELAFNIVKIVGALYLIFLGFSQWRSAPSSGPQANAESGPVPSFGRRVLIGFLTNATNPKGIVFMVAVLPSFITNQAPLLPQLVILAVTMVSIDLIVMHTYAFTAASLQNLLRDAKALRLQNKVFGAILMGVGAALFFVKRSPTSA
ncbi:MAG: LysE family transporter [Burkholderiales bacterium]|nr:LysE family transporter [Burkholderiales bacterium]